MMARDNVTAISVRLDPKEEDMFLDLIHDKASPYYNWKKTDVIRDLIEKRWEKLQEEN